MSTTHLAHDDYAFPSNTARSSYELSYALGTPPPTSLYSQADHGARASGSHVHAPLHTPSSRTSHSMYLPDHPEAFLMQYCVDMGDMGYPQFDNSTSSYSMAYHYPSPGAVYTASPRWGMPEGYGVPMDPTASSTTFLRNAIEYSDTTQPQQQSANQAQVVAPQSTAPSPSSWTLSGSLDPTTGVFQRSVDHPRLRTAQACEKCRVRKAKCSGDHPICQRCLSRGLQCEYAPERKMRGPNKQKRKSAFQTRTDTSASGERRHSMASAVSSGSDASVLDGHATATMVAGRDSRPSSRASYHEDLQSPFLTDAPRPRASTIGLGAIARAAEYTPSSPLHRQYRTGSPPIRQRPPPLDLSDVRQFSHQYPDMSAHYTHGEETFGAHGLPAAPGFGSASEARHPSLSPSILEAYSLFALENP
ncbi:hypothetical protein BC628DRAFT_1414955 [Trametes gibbosa]|nr:hypothetical protein BC628DRAFT_1414955 [Trametes gibbosa]UVI59111.1 Zn(2)-Cys(6)6 [Trametes gibbosa]